MKRCKQIWKKSKLKCEIIRKIWQKIEKRYGKYKRKQGKDMKNTKENSEKIWKIQKKCKMDSEMI